MPNEDRDDDRRETEVGVISIAARIPEFWTDSAKLWFIQFEAAVAPQHASDDTKYQLLIAKLGKQVIQQVADVLETPPATGKFQAVKDRLLGVYEDSENRRIQKLIGDMQLGNQKPSQLLRRMQNLAGTNVSKETLLVLWQNHLPAAIRTVLAATTLTDENKLASVADKVMETSKPIDIAGVSTEDNVASLTATVERLTLEVAELRRASGSQRRFQQDSKSRFRSRSRSRRGQSPAKKLCYYHSRFGEKATRCKNPCNWKSRRSQEN